MPVCHFLTFLLLGAPLTNHASPLRAYWDLEPTYAYHCVDIGIFTLTCGILNIITDFLCLVLPVPMIWNMQCERRTRLAILGMFGMGFLTCAAGIARTIYVDITLRKSYDMTWFLYPEHLTTALEVDIGMVSVFWTLPFSLLDSNNGGIIRSVHLFRRSEPYIFTTSVVKGPQSPRTKRSTTLGCALSRGRQSMRDPLKWRLRVA